MLLSEGQGVGSSPEPPGTSNPSKGTWRLRRDSHREDGSGTSWGKPGEQGGAGQFGVVLMGEGAYARAFAQRATGRLSLLTWDGRVLHQALFQGLGQEPHCSHLKPT